MFEEAISILSICSSMNSWLTPTVLFFLLNFMIGTIFFTSGFSSHKPSHHNNNLNNNNNINNHEFHQQQQPTFHYQQHQQQQQQQQPQLISRSSSVLQRLKSINFNSLYSTVYTQPPTTHYQSPQPPQQSEPESRPEPETSPVGSKEDDGEGPTMEEIYSRIKQGNQVSHYGRQNSDTKPSGGEIPVKLPQKMKKSASVKSPFNHFHFQPPNQSNNTDNNNNGNVGVAGKKATPLKKAEKKRESVKNANVSIKEEREDEGGVVESASVDAKADDFINRFKKQLQLQRNDSILRYKNMISSRFSTK